MNISLVAVDLAKNAFQLHGVDSRGKAVFRKRVRRDSLLAFFRNLPPCVVAFEACGGSHYWARTFREMGHQVLMIAPQFVKPYVKSNKTDSADAEAIAEAASRPSMRFVEVKTVEQQDLQAIHRVRERVVKSRTALCNEIRGLLAEFGVVINKGREYLRNNLVQILEEHEEALSLRTRELMRKLYEELVEVCARVNEYDKALEAIAKKHEICQRLVKIPGVGPITAVAIIAAVGDIRVFKNGRHFAAYLGLVPRQNSSGDTRRLLGISKRGDGYVRKLLVSGI